MPKVIFDVALRGDDAQIKGEAARIAREVANIIGASAQLKGNKLEIKGLDRLANLDPQRLRAVANSTRAIAVSFRETARFAVAAEQAINRATVSLQAYVAAGKSASSIAQKLSPQPASSRGRISAESRARLQTLFGLTDAEIDAELKNFQANIAKKSGLEREFERSLRQSTAARARLAQQQNAAVNAAQVAALREDRIFEARRRRVQAAARGGGFALGFGAGISPEALALGRFGARRAERGFGASFAEVEEGAKRAGLSVADFAKKKGVALTIEEKNAQALKRNATQMLGFGRAASQASTPLTHVVRVLRSLTIAFLGFQGLRLVQDLVRSFFEFQVTLENVRLGVAEVFLIQNRFVSRLSGQVLPIAQQIQSAFTLATIATERLVQRAADVGIPLNDVIQAFQVISGVAANANVSFDDQLDILSGIAVVAQRLNIPFGQLIKSVDNLFTGLQVQRTQIGIILGLTERIVKQERERGTLGEFYKERLEGVQAVLERENLKTWRGILEAVKAVTLQISRTALAPAFDRLKQVLGDIRERLVGMRDNAEVTERLAIGFRVLTNQIVAATQALGQFLASGSRLAAVVGAFAGFRALAGRFPGAGGVGALGGAGVGAVGGLGAALTLPFAIRGGLAAARGAAGVSQALPAIRSATSAAGVLGALGLSISAPTAAVAAVGVATTLVISFLISKAIDSFIGSVEDATAVAEQQIRQRDADIDRAARQSAEALALTLTPGATIESAGRGLQEAARRGLIPGAGILQQPSFRRLPGGAVRFSQVEPPGPSPVATEATIRGLIADQEAILTKGKLSAEERQATLQNIVNLHNRLVVVSQREVAFADDLTKELEQQGKIADLRRRAQIAILEATGSELEGRQRLLEVDQRRLEAQDALAKAVLAEAEARRELELARGPERRISGLRGQLGQLESLTERLSAAEDLARARGAGGREFDIARAGARGGLEVQRARLQADIAREERAIAESRVQGADAALATEREIAGNIENRLRVEREILNLRIQQEELRARVAGEAAAAEREILTFIDAQIQLRSTTLALAEADSEAAQKAQEELSKLQIQRLEANVAFIRARGEASGARLGAEAARRGADVFDLEADTRRAEGRTGLARAETELERARNAGAEAGENQLRMEEAIYTAQQRSRASVEELTNAYIDLGAEIKSALVDLPFEGTSALKNASQRIGRQLFEGLVQEKLKFDLRINKNFLQTIPDVAKRGGDLAGANFASGIDAVGSTSIDTFGSRFSGPGSAQFVNTSNLGGGIVLLGGANPPTSRDVFGTGFSGPGSAEFAATLGTNVGRQARAALLNDVARATGAAIAGATIGTSLSSALISSEARSQQGAQIGGAVGGAAGGLAAGAAFGSAAGPIGALVGALIGSLVGGALGKEKPQSLADTIGDDLGKILVRAGIPRQQRPEFGSIGPEVSRFSRPATLQELAQFSRFGFGTTEVLATHLTELFDVTRLAEDELDRLAVLSGGNIGNRAHAREFGPSTQANIDRLQAEGFTLRQNIQSGRLVTGTFPIDPAVSRLRLSENLAISTILFGDKGQKEVLAATNQLTNNLLALEVTEERALSLTRQLAKSIGVDLVDGLFKIQALFFSELSAGKAGVPELLAGTQASVSGLLKVLEEIPPAVDTVRISLGTIDETGIDIERIQRRVESVTAVVTEGIPAALREAIESHNIANVGQSLAETMAKAFEDRLLERLLQNAVIGKALTGATVEFEQAAEALERGDVAGFRRHAALGQQRFFEGVNVVQQAAAFLAPNVAAVQASLGLPNTGGVAFGTVPGFSVTPAPAFLSDQSRPDATDGEPAIETTSEAVTAGDREIVRAISGLAERPINVNVSIDGTQVTRSQQRAQRRSAAGNGTVVPNANAGL